MTIQAIETLYAGCRFRSRLEARWAVFFDTLGIEWDYEPQGFMLPSGPYLPDFWLPGVHARSIDIADANLGVWFEVKPRRQSADKRWSELSEVTRKALYVGIGMPRPPLDPGEEWIEEWSWGSWDDCMTFCNCDGAWVMKYGPESNYHPGGKQHRLVDHALAEARSARFEHGETGAKIPPTARVLGAIVERLDRLERITETGADAARRTLRELHDRPTLGAVTRSSTPKPKT